MRLRRSVARALWNTGVSLPTVIWGCVESGFRSRIRPADDRREYADHLGTPPSIPSTLYGTVPVKRISI